MMYSDHAPILLLPTSNRQRPKNPFDLKTGGFWKKTFRTLLKPAGNRSSTRSFSHKTRFLAADIKHWRRLKPKTRYQLHSIEEQILADQMLHPSQQNLSLQQQLHHQHQLLQNREEVYHIQRAKKRWAIKGERNKDFFHLSILKRHRKNTISYLTNLDGTHSTTPEQIADTVTTYFKSIFTSSISQTSNTALPHPSHSPSTPASALPNPDLADFTYSTPDLYEIHTIIKAMRSNATPGPDGLNAAFYKATWSWFKQDVHNLVSTFYDTASLPTELNQTFITLIPKNPILQSLRTSGL
jgi:hypothetical protein